jgi:hypothetical protein
MHDAAGRGARRARAAAMSSSWFIMAMMVTISRDLDGFEATSKTSGV